jgi:hypothetical protein
MIFAHIMQPALTAVKENWPISSSRKLAFFDWLLLNALFWAIHIFFTGSLLLPVPFVKLILLINAAWLLFSTLEHKFSLRSVHTFAELALKLFQITLLMLFAVSLILLVTGAHNFNRFYLLGTCGGLLLAELFIAGLYYPRLYEGMQEEAAQVRHRMDHPYALSMVFFDIALYSALFFLVHYLKYNTLHLELRHWQLLVIMAGIWVFSARWTGKFEQRNHPTFYHAYEPYVKAAFILIAAAAALLYSIQILNYSRTLLFAPVALLLLLEAPAVLIWHRVRSVENRREEADIESITDLHRFLEETALEVSAAPFDESARARLEEHYLAGRPELFSLVDRRCKLDKIALQSLLVLDTHTSYNVQMLENNALQMFVNLHRVNDFRRLNHYFLEVQQKLVKGGYFIGVMDTVEAAWRRYQARFPKYMAMGLYSLDFAWRRILPKIPGLEKLYFAVSRGRNRAFPRAELLGRLYFCGFRILAAEEINGQLCFVAQRDRRPGHTQDPTYGLLIRLKRIGYQGRPFYLYKLRTMHPYSEFIQHYVYRNHHLAEGGKFQDDFRIAGWGRLVRKLWLDELPQLYNWLRGDLKLVGARALSDHYFSLYPPELQALRIRFKPGLIPPYYADMPKTMEEIQESERRYFAAKQAHPWRADWEYFFRAFYNIVIKRARSK